MHISAHTIRLLWMVLALTAQTVKSQSAEHGKSVDFREKVLLADADRLGNFYLVTEHAVHKYAPDSRHVSTWARNEANPIRHIGPWNPLQIMLHIEGHRFQVLSQDLDEATEIQLDEALALNPRLITPGIFNRTAWLLDEDYSVKKIDWSANRVLTEFKPFPSGQEPVHPIQIRAYQDHVFLLDAQDGLHIMGRTGVQVRHIKLQSARNMGVLGEDVFVYQQGLIRFIDIYNKDEYTISVPTDSELAVATDEAILLIRPGKLEFRKFRPQSD